MAIKRALAIIPLVAPLVGAQNAILAALQQNGGGAGAATTTSEPMAVAAVPAVTTTSEESTTDAIPAAAETTATDNVETTDIPATEEEQETVTAPEYDEEECDSWIQTLQASDGDGTGGINGPEYYTFLSSITNPPYVGEYFKENSVDFPTLPWTFRVIHKTLACHCEQLDMGENCCKGDRGEVLILGLGDTVQQTRDATQEEYRDMFCQHIAYAVGRAIPSPAPTENPTFEPTKGPTVSPTPAPSTSPTPAPTPEPTSEPTLSPTLNSTEVPAPVVAIKSTPEPEKDEGLSTGGIIGIIAAILIAIMAIIAMVAYRRKLERDRLRQFAGDQAPEADLEAPSAAMDGPDLDPKPEPADEPSPGDNPDEDDESSAPSVWSQSDDEETGTEMHDTNEEERLTAGSALAAMGAASTVTKNLMHQPSGNGSDGSGGGVV